MDRDKFLQSLLRFAVVKIPESEAGSGHFWSAMAEKNGKFYVFYDETEAVGMQGTKTTIKWNYDNVVIIRSGTVESRQEFAQGLECISVYKTPYITFGLKTNTEYLYVYCRDGIWNIELEYMLEIAGQEQSEMKIKITIEEDAHGH